MDQNMINQNAGNLQAAPMVPPQAVSAPQQPMQQPMPPVANMMANAPVAPGAYNQNEKKGSEDFKKFLNDFLKKLKPQSTGIQAEVNTQKKQIDFNEIMARLNPKNSKRRLVPQEINLVPDIKDETIRTLKLRNFIFFLSIVVAGASAGMIAFFASVAGGQQAIVDSKKTMIDNMSAKIASYSDLSDFITIKDQLSNISTIVDNKKMLSRTFGVLSALIPTGADTITISELTVNLEEEDPTLIFDAQANAGAAPYIDYNVLDSFKKSMQYMRYDYGKYVDKEGAEIPAYCIIENGADGGTLIDKDRGYYAYWTILGDGCNPSYIEEEPLDEEEDSGDDTESTDEEGTNGSVNNTASTNSAIAEADAIRDQTKGYDTEDYGGQTVVKIWRTPQFAEWYKDEKKTGQPYMSLDGTISNVAHFESECTSYTGYENEDTGEITWSSSNDTCELVPEGTDGIVISDSSNGRGATGELVLRFSAVITMAPEVYNFNNHHMMAVAPSARYNVTDSFVQIQNMFGERAADCAADDAACRGSIGGN